MTQLSAAFRRPVDMAVDAGGASLRGHGGGRQNPPRLPNRRCGRSLLRPRRRRAGLRRRSQRFGCRGARRAARRRRGRYAPATAASRGSTGPQRRSDPAQSPLRRIHPDSPGLVVPQPPLSDGRAPTVRVSDRPRAHALSADQGYLFAAGSEPRPYGNGRSQLFQQLEDRGQLRPDRLQVARSRGEQVGLPLLARSGSPRGLGLNVQMLSGAFDRETLFV